MGTSRRRPPEGDRRCGSSRERARFAETLRLNAATSLFLGALACLVGCGGGQDAGPGAAAGIELPVVGTLGHAPSGPDTIEVGIDRDGRISLGGLGPLDLVSLQKELAARTPYPGARALDGTSKKRLLIRADAAVPWIVPCWVTMAAADPRVEIYQVFLAARARGDGALGAIGWRLPVDRSGPRPFVRDAAPRILTLRLRMSDGVESDPAAILSELRRVAGDRPVSEITLEVKYPPPRGATVPTEFVAQVLDQALRAGVRRVTFEGSPFPGGYPQSPDASPSLDPADANALLTYVRSLAAAGGKPTIRVRTEDLGGASPGDRLPDRGLLPGLYEAAEESDVVLFEEPILKADEPRSEAVDAGLRWLAAHQAPDGRWSSAGFGSWCEYQPVPEGEGPDGAAASAHDVRATGLALLAFLGAGHTNRGRHPFAQVVARGLRHLKNQMTADGSFAETDPTTALADDATATLALVRAYALTESPIHRGAAGKAVAFLLRTREGHGGWTATVRAEAAPDEALAWIALALVAARDANDDATTKGHAAVFPEDLALADLQDALDAAATASTDALGLAAWLRGRLGGDGAKDPRAVQAQEALARDPLAWPFGAASLPRLVSEGGGALESAIRAAARRGSTPCLYEGSWDPVGPWGREQGRVATTALAALGLEVFAGYPDALR